MSKKLKNKSKGFIPSAMKGKIFSSLSCLGDALGIKPTEQPTPKSMKCRKCGAVMRNISGTNVWVCDNMVEQGEGDAKKTVPCGNRAMTTARPAQNSDNPKPKKNIGKVPGKAPIAVAE